MHIDDMIFFWARAKPHQPAIIQPDTIITYRGLAEAIDSISGRLAQLDLDRREAVAVSIEHPAKHLAVCLALLRAGYSASPIYRGLLPHLRTAGVNNVIYESEGQVISGGRNIRFDNSWLPTGAAPRLFAATPRKRPDKSPDLIFFTSGTTGLPKKIVQTEEALIERMHICALTGDQSYARVLILPGLSTNFGFNRACEVLREGKTACFSLPDEGRLVLISTYGIDRIVASPQQALGLCDMRDANPGYQLDCVKMVRIGGAFASREAVKRVQTSICRNIVTEYGSTEASLVAVAAHEMIADIPDAVGFVGPWTELEIVDEAGRPLPAGSEGRIRYRTPFFVKNYAANHPGSGDGRDAWYYPGDLGYVTDNGVLCIRGRGDDVINCGGLKVSAASLEEIVLACSGVKDAGVCGVKGDSGLEEIWIGIVADGSFELPEFQRQLELNPRFNELLKSVGAEVVSVDAIPRNQLGKIQRHELRERLLTVQKAPPP
jgi:acyl-coenzyme A synthetase/AMP-(fatty) acid ligase